MVIGMYVALIWVGLAVVNECRFAFGRLLGLGILATIGIQAVINIAVVTVVVPTKGIALPLMSSGGTGWILCAAAIGLLAAIDRINRMGQVEGEELLGELPVAAPVSVSAGSPAPQAAG
jgi:cell division protein FtsW